MLIGLGGVYQAAAAVTPDVLARGARIHGGDDIAFDSEDRMYVASIYGRDISLMDKETGEILERFGTDKGVEGPVDITFGPDGSLYWTASFVGEVGRLSPDGITTKQFVAPGVNPMVFSDDGRLFVGLTFFGDALYELDPNLKEEPRLIAEKLGGINSFDFGPDGFLYSPIMWTGEIIRIDVDTGEITPVADGFDFCWAAKFDSQGRLYVIDGNIGEVVRVDTETGSKELIASVMPCLSNLAFDSEDRMFIPQYTDGAIFEILPDGTVRTVSPRGMVMPSGVAVLPRADGGESVFVADVWSLREFDGLTGEQLSIEMYMFGTPGIVAPTTVSSDGKHLVLTSWMGNTAQVWNSETGEELEVYEDFDKRRNAIRFQGDLVVAEAGTGSVVRASAANPEERVTLADGLSMPIGLAATDDDLWVGDWETGMVLQIVADGETLAEPIPVATGLALPEGLAVAPDGNLLVVETGVGQLSSINLETGEISTVAEGLELGAQPIPGIFSSPTWMFNGVAVGPSGTIYITSDINNQLLVIRPEDFSNVFFMSLTAGLNMISTPLKPRTPYTARTFAEELSATAVIKLDEARQRFVGFTLDAPDDGFDIEGGKGYIVNVKESGVVAFTGAAWTNQPPIEAAPEVRDFGYPMQLDGTWAFVVSGGFEDDSTKNGYRVTVRNARTNAVATDVVRKGYFAAAFADLTRKNVVEIGDRLEVVVKTQAGEIASETFTYTVTAEAIHQAFMPITLKNIEKPRQNLLLQNYPNPFNPETWIPYQLRESSDVEIRIYNAQGHLVRVLDLGHRKAGFYLGRVRAAYWNGRNNAGEKIASGAYFYQIQAGDFSATRKMLIVK